MNILRNNLVLVLAIIQVGCAGISIPGGGFKDPEKGTLIGCEPVSETQKKCQYIKDGKEFWLLVDIKDPEKEAKPE